MEAAPESTSCLVDTATLRATSRVLGKTASPSRASVDVDLSAFEQFVTNVLFCDSVHYVKTPRSSEIVGDVFGGRIPDFMRAVEIGERDERVYADVAIALMRDDFIRLESRTDASRLMNDFMALLDAHVSVTWSSGSKVQDLFAELTSSRGTYMSGNELFREVMRWKTPDPHLAHADKIAFEVDSREGRYRSIAITEQLASAIKALNWLLYRSCYYLVVAINHGSWFSPHPTRAVFSSTIVGTRLGMSSDLYEAMTQKIRRAGNEVSRDIRQDIELGLTELEIPIFSAWIANHGKKARTVVERLLEMRALPMFVAFRRRLASYAAYTNEGENSRSLLRARADLNDINAMADALRREFGVRTAQGTPTAPLIILSNAALATAGMPFKIPDLGVKIPEWMTRSFVNLNKPHRQILRSLVRDLADIPKLGFIHEKLTSNMIFLDTGQPARSKHRTSANPVRISASGRKRPFGDRRS